jgi:hypothetical protein
MASRADSRPYVSIHRVTNGGSDGGIKLDRFFYFKIIKISDGSARRPRVGEVAISGGGGVSILTIFVGDIGIRVTVIRLASEDYKFVVLKASFEVRDDGILKSYN